MLSVVSKFIFNCFLLILPHKNAVIVLNCIHINTVSFLFVWGYWVWTRGLALAGTLLFEHTFSSQFFPSSLLSSLPLLPSFLVLGFEFRAYTLSYSTSPFFVMGFFFEINYLPRLTFWTAVLLISSSWVARITGMSHWHWHLGTINVDKKKEMRDHYSE
jgi:hypothetical protein